MGEVLKFQSGTKAAGIEPGDFRDVMGRFRTQSLFKEMNSDKKYPAYFTLKDQDVDGMISMRRVYLEISDPVEYETAQVLLGDYKHWQVLCSRDWFKEHVEQWRLELEAKLDSEAVRALRKTTNDDKSTSRASCARTMLEKPWRTKQSLRGRPSKDEQAGYLKRASEEISEIEEDRKRLFGEGK